MTFTTGGLRFFTGTSSQQIGTWLAQRLACWQKANPTAHVTTITYPSYGYEVANPIPAGLILKDGGHDYSTDASADWQEITVGFADVTYVNPETCTNSSGAPAYMPWEFSVEAYGAKGDGITDDVAAINTAMAAGYAWATGPDGHGYFELVFKPTTYLLAGAPTTGGTTHGSAQIPLPVVAQTAQKVTLVLRGSREQTGLYHWLQTTPQRAGTVLRSTWDAGNTEPATGEVSVIGGPTPHFMGDPPSAWDNILVVIDGISVEVPTAPNICGFDFRTCAEAYVKNAGVLALSAITGAPAIPPARWAFGLAMPVTANNAKCDIGYYSAEGLTYGLIVYEHVQASSVRLVNCYDGLLSWSSSGFPHGNIFTYAMIENCTQLVALVGSVGKLEISTLDVEWASGAIITDTCAAPSHGTINIRSNGTDGDTLNTAMNTGGTAVVGTGLRIVNLDQKTGSVTAPALPATGVAFKNPFWRDATVTVTGGVVTSIAVDGVAQGVTSGPVSVPSGKTVTLAFSDGTALAWKWVLQ